MKVHIGWDPQLVPKKRRIFSGAMMQIGTFYQVSGKLKKLKPPNHIMMVVDGVWRNHTNHTSINKLGNHLLCWCLMVFGKHQGVLKARIFCAQHLSKSLPDFPAFRKVQQKWWKSTRWSSWSYERLSVFLRTWQFCDRDLFGMVSLRDPFKGLG